MYNGMRIEEVIRRALYFIDEDFAKKARLFAACAGILTKKTKRSFGILITESKSILGLTTN